MRSSLTKTSLKSVLVFLLVLLSVTAHPQSLRAEGGTVDISYCEFHITHQFAVETVREAYNQAGIRAKFSARPCRRSLVEANAGRYDGEVARINGTDKAYPNLLLIKAPTATIEGVVITQNIDKKITSWDDLKGLRVGIIRGELYAEKGSAALNVSVAASYNQLLKLLIKDRIEVGIVILRDWQLAMNSPEFYGTDIHTIGKPVFSATLHHLVHNRNKKLLPKLNQIFEKMWTSGQAVKIHQQTMRKLTGK